MIRGNPRITAKAIAGEIGISPRNVQAHMRVLKELGYIDRVGSPKGGRWITSKEPDVNK